jgi:hypothetical protein
MHANFVHQAKVLILLGMSTAVTVQQARNRMASRMQACARTAALDTAKLRLVPPSVTSVVRAKRLLEGSQAAQHAPQGLS